MLVLGKEWKPLVSDLYVRVPLNFFSDWVAVGFSPFLCVVLAL